MNAQMAAETNREQNGDMPFIKPEDMEFFGKLVDEEGEDATTRTPEEERDITIMKLLLRIKNGKLIYSKSITINLIQILTFHELFFLLFSFIFFLKNKKTKKVHHVKEK